MPPTFLNTVCCEASDLSHDACSTRRCLATSCLYLSCMWNFLLFETKMVNRCQESGSDLPNTSKCVLTSKSLGNCEHYNTEHASQDHGWNLFSHSIICQHLCSPHAMAHLPPPPGTLSWNPLSDWWLHTLLSGHPTKTFVSTPSLKQQ